MPTLLHPLYYPIALLVFLLPVATLALLPAYPHSRAAKALWAFGLVLAVGLYAWNVFLKPPAHEFWSVSIWKVPAWHPWILGLVAIAVPFSTSFILWRLRLRSIPGLTATVTTVVLVATCLFAVIALRVFNETCTYFDYHNDLGQAWCPANWQAHR